MAYAFSQITDMLGGQQKQDIFGQQNTDDSSQNTGAIDPSIKTNTEADLGTSQSYNFSGSSGSNQVKDVGSKQNSRERVYQANAGKIRNTSGVTRLGDKLTQNSEALQKKADTYASEAAAQAKTDYSVDSDTIDRGVSGSQDDYDKTQRVLSTGQAKAKDLEFDAKDYRVDDIDNLRTTAGLRRLASEGQGRRYNEGMSAFDTTLMQQDEGFNKQVADINARGRDHDERLGELPYELRSEAQRVADETLANSKTSIKDTLGTLKASTIEANEIDFQGWKDKVGSLDIDALKGSYGDEARQRVLEAMEQNPVYAGRVKDLMGGAVEGDFITRANVDDYTYEDFLDESEASRLNSITSLLGGSDLFETGRNPVDTYSVDEQGLEDAIYAQTASAREARDREQMAQIDAIMASNSSDAQTQNARVASEREAYRAALMAKQKEYQDAGGFYDETWMSEFENENLGPAQSFETANMLDVDERRALEQAYADLGLDVPESVGAQDFLQANSYSFDPSSYDAFVKEKLAARQSALAQAEAEAQLAAESESTPVQASMSDPNETLIDKAMKAKDQALRDGGNKLSSGGKKQLKKWGF